MHNNMESIFNFYELIKHRNDWKKEFSITNFKEDEKFASKLIVVGISQISKLHKHFFLNFDS